MKNWKKVLVLAALAAALLTLSAAAAQLPEEERFGRAAGEALSWGETLAFAYDQLDAGIADFSPEIRLGSAEYPMDVEKMTTVVDIYLKDHPEIVWLDSGYSYYPPSGGVCRLLPRYTMSAQQAAAVEAEMEAVAEELLESVHDGMSELEKELRIHDNLAAHVTYASSANCHSAYGALIEGVAVCDGYTEAFQYLLNKVGIQSYKVTGTSRGEGHAWNLVRIDGEYYYADVTWDDQGDDLYHAWLNITTERLAEDHWTDPVENSLPLPECTATDANYFEVYGGMVEELSVETVTNLFRTSRDGVARLYAAMDDYESVWTWFQENIWDICEVLEIYGGFSYGYGQCGREWHLRINGYVPPVIPEHVHTVVTDPAVEPTCVEGGRTEGSHCASCGEVLKAQTDLPARGHVWESDWDSQCDVCGEKREITYPVSNVHIDWSDEFPCLVWTAPAGISGARYNVTGTTADGGEYEVYNGWNTSVNLIFAYMEGVTGIRIQTVVEDAVVGETLCPELCIAIDRAVLPEPQTRRIQKESDGKLKYEVGAFEPNMLLYFGIKSGGKSVYGKLISADETGLLTWRDEIQVTIDKIDLNDVVMAHLYGFTDIALSEDGNTLSYTIHAYEGGNLKLESGGEEAAASVSVTVPAGAEVHFNGVVYPAEGGKVTVENVAGGTYDLAVKKPGCLTYTVTGITVGTEDIDLGTVALWAGDTNNDGMINIMDMGVFRQNFGKMGVGIVNPYTDTNGDNMVNIIDMSVFRSNFGKTAANDCTVEYQA